MSGERSKPPIERPIVSLTPERRSGLQHGFRHPVSQMIRWRFGAVQEKIPDQLSNLVKKLEATSDVDDQSRPSEQQTAARQPFVPCPLCLGTGANAAQRHSNARAAEGVASSPVFH